MFARHGELLTMRSTDGSDQANVVPGASAPCMAAFLLLLMTAGILECWQLAALRDPEIWGHLGIGSWILEHRSLPESGVFSQAAGLPWRDFSWGFDLLVGVMHRTLGLRALPALLIVFRMALVAITFQLAGGWRNFWVATVLSAISQYILFSAVPLAGFVSVLLFGVELFLLLEWRKSSKLRSRFAWPGMFFVWANLDMGFVYGIVLYAVFLIVLAVEAWDESRKKRWLEHAAGKIPLATAAGMGGACLIAGCATPNTVHAYGAFFADEFSAINANLSNYHAMGFRQPQDYALMLLGMAAFLSLGVIRSRNLFSIALLSGCAALAFFAQREGWLLTLASVAVLGNAILRPRKTREEEQSIRWDWQRRALAGAAVTLVFLVFAMHVPRNHEVLLHKVAEKMPVRAADFLRQHRQPAPLFNPYQWGGFLIWYLPEYPVAMDERRGLYPEQQELDYFQAMNADIPYRNCLPMNRARTFLMDKAGVMGEAFRGVAGFQVLYEDNVAIVYAHEIRE